MLKMTQTLMTDWLKTNKARESRGLAPLSWEDYTAQVEAGTPPNPELVARPVDFVAYANAASLAPEVFAAVAADPSQLAAAKAQTAAKTTQPPGTMDAALYAKNLAAVRGLFGAMTAAQRAELMAALGAASATEEQAIEALAMTVTQLGYDLEAIANEALKIAPQAAGEDIFRKIQNEIGRTLEHVGAEVKRWTKVPVLKNLIGPLGVKATGELLYQTGRMLHGGSVRDFDDRAMVAALAESLGDIGRLHAIAAPFLPAPWNAVAGAIAVVCTGASKVMRAQIQNAENKERIAAGLAPLDANGNEIAPQAAPVQLYKGNDGNYYLFDGQRYTLADATGQPILFSGTDGNYYYYDGQRGEYYLAQVPIAAGCDCRPMREL